jgi:hypothetical protein
LRFAGTGDDRAKSAIFERVVELQTLREANDAISAASRPEFTILNSCLACAAISLAMVLAGTGDLEALKLFKILRWRCEEDSRYGSHMLFGMAIGLLFLGGGTCTLGREPSDVACLVAALFPRFPENTSDNQNHLQACRHLYALAVRRKELCAIDVDTGEMVHVPVEIKTDASSTPLRLSVPCLLRNSESRFEELRVVSDCYYPLKLNLCESGQSYAFFVKKRSSQLNQLHTMALEHHNATATNNPFIHSYTHYIDRPSDTDFFARALSECRDEDIEEALAFYLTLDNGQSVHSLEDLRMIRTYYQERHRILKDNSKPLLNVDLLLAYLQEMAKRSLVNTSDEVRARGIAAFYDD